MISALPPSQQNPFFGGDDMFVNIWRNVVPRRRR
jgi:hypothetical protein